MDRLGKAADVGLVERGIDLVEQAEGARLVLEDRKDQRDRRQRLFAAAHQLEGAEALAWWLGDDVDTRFEDVVRVGQPELGLSSAEEHGVDALEALVDPSERLAEHRPALAVHLADRLVELGERVLEVAALAGEVLVALGVLLVFLDRGEVDLAHAIDQPLQFLGACRDFGIGHGPCVVVADDIRELDPMLVEDLLFEVLERKRELPLAKG